MSVAVFPRPLFTDKWKEADFVLSRRQAIGFLESGDDVGIDRGGPQWKINLRSNRLTGEQLGSARAWGDSLRGITRRFLAWDPLREYPLAYMPTVGGAPGGWPAGMVRWDGAAFDGTAVLGAISASGIDGSTGRDVVEIADLPNGFTFSAGDYVAVQWSDAPATPPSADFASGANSWAATNGTFAANSGAMLFTPTGSNSYLARTGLTVAGATYGRLHVDVERTVTGGTALNRLTFIDNAAASFNVNGIRWPSTLARARLIIDLAADATWPTKTVSALRFLPVSTAAGAFLFRSVRLEDSRPAKQRYSLHRVLDAAPVSANAAGVANLWLEPELPASVLSGAKVNLYRPSGKFRLVSGEATHAGASAEGGPRPGDYSLEAVSTIR